MSQEIMPLLTFPARIFTFEIANSVSEISGYRIVVFIENQKLERCRETLDELLIIWFEKLSELADTHAAVSAVVTGWRGQAVENIESIGMSFPTSKYPSAMVLNRRSLREITFLNYGVIVATHTTIVRHVRVNRGELIRHHAEIGDYVTVQFGTNVAGFCRIGSAMQIGMGAAVLDEVAVEANSIVGTGSSVIKDVSKRDVVVGMPFEIIRKNAPDDRVE